MSLHRLIILCSILSLGMAVMAQAQNAAPVAQTTSIKQQMDAIGQGLNDDRVDMYDRYVYNDSQTVDKKVALNLPVLPNQDVQEWLSENIAQIMTVTPTLYPMHQKQVAKFFVPSGLAQFDNQWRQSRISNLVTERGYSLTALVIKSPQIVAKGRENNVYRWIADVPVLLTYTKPGDNPAPYDITLRLGLTRIPMQEDGHLIAIDRWDLAPPPVVKKEEEKPIDNVYGNMNY